MTTLPNRSVPLARTNANLPFSASISGNALAFVSDGTKYGEIEAGLAGNEPVNLALRAAIDAAVIEIIKQGELKGYWKFKSPNPNPHNKIP